MKLEIKHVECFQCMSPFEIEFDEEDVWGELCYCPFCGEKLEEGNDDELQPIYTYMDYENPWLYNNQPFTSDHIGDSFGFVYLIESTVDGRFYIGKKFFTKAKQKQVKGKKKKFRVESDWQDYYSSSEELQELVKQHGKQTFRRTILKLCKNKSQCTYWEAHYQFEKQVLLNENSLNKWISAKVRKNSQLT